MTMPPTGAMRASSAGSRLRRIAVAGVLLALGAWLIYWLATHQPTLGENRAGIPVYGQVGETVVARAMAVTVPSAAGIRAGQVLEYPGALGNLQPGRVTTRGLWLAVPVRVRPLLDSGPISARLQARDGKRYSPWLSSGTSHGRYQYDGVSGQLRNLNVGGAMFGAGIDTEGVLYFELPPEQLDGVQLHLFAGGSEQPNDNIIKIDLGLDAANAKALTGRIAPRLPTFAIRAEASP